MKTPMTKLMLAATAALSICLGVEATTVDLSTLTSNYTARDGDVLTGATNFGITIPDGETVTLSNATITCSSRASAIGCEGDATIILADGTVNTVSQSEIYYATIAIGRVGTTLTIKGNTGKLIASTPFWWFGAIGSYDYDGGNIIIEGGIVEALGQRGGIGWGYSGSCSSVTIKGGTVTATATATTGGCGINCTTFNVESTVKKVELSGTAAAINAPNVTISNKLNRDESDGGKHIILEPSLMVDGDGTENDPYVLTDKEDLLMALVKGDPNPMYVRFTEGLEIEGPITVPASINALSCDLNGGAITGVTGQPAIILVGDTAFAATGTGTISADDGIEAVKRPGSVTAANGVTVTGIGGGAAVDAPSFSDSGESAVTKFEGAGNTWTLTAFAEMEGDSVGTAVTDGQIKVYAADSVEGLEDAEPVSEGVTVTERKSAVKTTIEVVLPSTPEKQFFKVKFGE